MVSKKEEKYSEEEQQKWFMKEDFQDLAKIGGDFLRKTVLSGMDVLKDAKENIPKEASQLLLKGKEELLKSLSQETAKNLITFSIEKFFKLACQHRLEFSIRIRKNEDTEPKKDVAVKSRTRK